MKTKTVKSQNNSAKRTTDVTVVSATGSPSTDSTSTHHAALIVKHKINGGKILAFRPDSVMNRVRAVECGGYALAAIEHRDGSAQVVVVGHKIEEAVMAQTYRAAIRIMSRICELIKTSAVV